MSSVAGRRLRCLICRDLDVDPLLSAPGKKLKFELKDLRKSGNGPDICKTRELLGEDISRCLPSAVDRRGLRFEQRKPRKKDGSLTLRFFADKPDPTYLSSDIEFFAEEGRLVVHHSPFDQHPTVHYSMLCEILSTQQRGNKYSLCSWAGPHRGEAWRLSHRCSFIKLCVQSVSTVLLAGCVVVERNMKHVNLPTNKELLYDHCR